MAEIRLSFEIVHPETGEVHRIGLFVEAPAELVPVEPDGPTSMEGYEPGALLEVGLLLQDMEYSWELVHHPLSEVFQPVDEDQEPDAEETPHPD